MSLITGIHHVCVKCSESDYPKVIDFYTKVLDGQCIREWDGGCHIGFTGEILEIFVTDQDQLPQGVIRHYSLATNNVDEAVKRVKEAGYPVVLEPRDIQLPSKDLLQARIAFVLGPLGEEIEFFDEK